jgi:hypothetical protein
LRLAWIACAALALSACTGPGLEPPGSEGDSNTVGGPKQTRDAGIPHQGGSDTGNMGSTGSGGRSSTGGSNSSGGSGGTPGGNGGSAGNHKPPVSQDAGAPVDAGDEDAG